MFIIKVVLIVCVALFWISLFYNLIIKNIIILGKHTDVIRNMLSKDLNKRLSNMHYYGSYYFFHILSYGILFDAYNNSKNNQYVAYLLELLCVFVRYIIFISLTCQCIIYIIIIFRVFN